MYPHLCGKRCTECGKGICTRYAGHPETSHYSSPIVEGGCGHTWEDFEDGRGCLT